MLQSHNDKAHLNQVGFVTGQNSTCADTLNAKFTCKNIGEFYMDISA
jgi:hypothetical protein